MGAEVILAGIGIGGSLLSQTKSTKALRGQQEATRQVAEISAQQEEVRKQQMNLEFQRKQREIIRQTQAARSSALVAGANQGALQGSGVQGGVSSVVATGATNLNQNVQARDIGASLFDLNANLARAQARVANFQGEANRWQTYGNLFGTVATNAGTFGRVLETGLNIFNVGSDPYKTATRRFG